MIIDFVPVALSADSVDWVEVSDAAALSVVEYFIDSASDDTEAGSLDSVSGWACAGVALCIIGGVALALGAGSIDEVK